MITDIAEFLRVRIADDEHYARWVLDCGYASHVAEWEAPSSAVVFTGDEVIPTGDSALTNHIIRWDPARVLAECAAKRALIAEVLSWQHRYVDEDCYFSCAQAVQPGESEPGSGCCNDERSGKPCDCGLERRQLAILGPMAAVHVDHEDYRTEWAPNVSTA